MPRPNRFFVMSKRDDEDFVEAIRTGHNADKAAAEDVQLLKDICRRHAWVSEHG